MYIKGQSRPGPPGALTPSCPQRPSGAPSRGPYSATPACPLCRTSQKQRHALKLFTFFSFFWPQHTACGILVPQVGIKLSPPAAEAQSLNPWTTREVPRVVHFLILLWCVCVFVVSLCDPTDCSPPGSSVHGILQIKPQFRDFPGGPGVKTLPFHCRGCGFDPWLGN